MNHTQQHAPSLGWLPSFEDVPSVDVIGHKATRSNKLARDMRDKVRARRAEDRRVMELADYYHPFLEA